MERLPCILTVAGSDSGGGAGIQADIKTISMLGGYAASVITALTAQNTAAVTGIHAPSDSFVALQLRTVLDDIQVDAAKTGMLFSEPIIKAIAPILSKAVFPVVVDPVCVATSGAKLLKDDAVDAMKRLIFPCATILTPNIPETELFTGIKINDRDDIFKAAKLLLDMGPQAVLIKGGHADSLAITDWFMEQDGEPVPFMQQRVQTKSTHGTGCTLSAAIATGLGQGMDAGKAVRRAQAYLNTALRAGYPLGEGGGPPNHLAPWLKLAARMDVLADLDHFGRWLSSTPAVHDLLPRSRANVAVSLPLADDIEEVAAFSGGIIGTQKGDVMIGGYPEFGASLRTASTLLAVQRLNAEINCAITIGLVPGLKGVLDDLGVPAVWIDRDRKPDYVDTEKGRLEEWGAFEAVREHEAPENVRVVGDPGGVGAEPLVRILAEDASALQGLLSKIVEKLVLNRE